jgi:hypothetical protein
MNTQDEKQDAAQTSPGNPFPEPQTIPAGWDMSEFSPAPAAAGPQVEDAAGAETE